MGHPVARHVRAHSGSRRRLARRTGGWDFRVKEAPLPILGRSQRARLRPWAVESSLVGTAVPAGGLESPRRQIDVASPPQGTASRRGVPSAPGPSVSGPGHERLRREPSGEPPGESSHASCPANGRPSSSCRQAWSCRHRSTRFWEGARAGRRLTILVEQLPVLGRGLPRP